MMLWNWMFFLCVSYVLLIKKIPHTILLYFGKYLYKENWIYCVKIRFNRYEILLYLLAKIRGIFDTKRFLDFSQTDVMRENETTYIFVSTVPFRQSKTRPFKFSLVYRLAIPLNKISINNQSWFDNYSFSVYAHYA